MDGDAPLARRPAGQPAPGQAGLVERVAGLVQHAHQGGDHLVLAVAGGDADVGGRAAAERVRALVEPAGLEVEAEPGHQRAAELLLRRGRERPGRPERRRHGGLARQDRIQQRRQARPRAGRTAAPRRRRADRAGARRAARRRADRPSAAPVTAASSRTSRTTSVSSGASMAKSDLARASRQSHLAGGGGARHRLDQRRLERMGVAVPAPHLAQVGLLPGVEVGLLLGRGQLLAGLGDGSGARGRAA